MQSGVSLFAVNHLRARFGFLLATAVLLMTAHCAWAQHGNALPTSSTSSSQGDAPLPTKTDSPPPLPGSTENTVTPAATTPPKDDASKNKDKAPTPESGASAQSSLVRWYGHAFIYIINSTGVRVAIDPFARETVKYLFPVRLPADTVLISTEADDHAAGELLFGTPQIFRSYTAVGVNKANGLIFKGVSVSRTPRGSSDPAQCTAFVFQLDGVTFAHLGVIGDILDSRQRQEIGKVDVLFLPIGNPLLTISDLNKMITDTQAKIIIPITYRTDFTPGMNLRSLDDFMREQKLPVKQLEKTEFPINASLLPTQPTIYLYPLP